ncbi:CASP-like protein 4A1 [Tripterygium wilfordii]|uniref:CASP-like protein 4A1 n=1 Tax=Tripterygium wilfordii TaxID=458696 RepID=UPI0018F83464|nr:CASP-like protein 4A1 [Tripterygium wilfordii]
MEGKNPKEIEKKDIGEVEKEKEEEDEEEEETTQEHHDQTIANPPLLLLPSPPQSHDHPNSKSPPSPLDSPPDTNQPKNPPSPALDTIKLVGSIGPDTHRDVEFHDHPNSKSQPSPLDSPLDTNQPKNPPSPPLDAMKVAGSIGPDTHKEVEEGERKPRPNQSIRRRSKRNSLVRRALLGFRIFGFLFSMVSFSVLVADRDQGWAIDSFYRYKEFRYCLSVNVIAFVYLGAQAFDLAYSLSTGNHKTRTQLRYYLDFSIDQVLAYLLLSSSSSAAIRVDDWQSNWGKDKFPEMARASVTFSFLAFAALAFCSLMSGYISLESM